MKKTLFIALCLANTVVHSATHTLQVPPVVQRATGSNASRSTIVFSPFGEIPSFGQQYAPYVATQTAAQSARQPTQPPSAPTTASSDVKHKQADASSARAASRDDSYNDDFGSSMINVCLARWWNRHLKRAAAERAQREKNSSTIHTSLDIHFPRVQGKRNVIF